MLLADLVAVSDEVRSTRARTAKVGSLAGFLRRLGADEAPVAVAYLSGAPRQPKLGVGYATVAAVSPEPATDPGLTLLEVDAALDDLAAIAGPGSKAAREARLADLLGRATSPEQAFLRALILRELRQGAQEGVMADAVADALGVPAVRVRRAAMLAGDLVAVASIALAEGSDALGGFALEVFTPVQPMLAQTGGDAEEAVAATGQAAVEWKLDGVRIQVHRSEDRVAVFTRNLREVTDRLPEVVAVARSLDASRLILDGEALLVDGDGRPVAFQDSMSRFGTEDADAERLLHPFFFDCLHLDGADLIDEPTRRRLDALDRLVPAEHRVTRITTDDPAAAAEFFAAAVAAGQEGVMVKALDAPYEAGRRGGAWLKVKPVHTLDLVVLAAEWGSGRRRGKLSNLHLGARDPAGGFIMLGKTFKGLTDDMLEWQTGRFLEIETGRDGHVLHVRPEVVVEVAFDGVQRSTRYPGGVTLRFARVKRYREDKTADQADTIDEVRALHRG
jgi:DNA ligase 1